MKQRAALGVAIAIAFGSLVPTAGAHPEQGLQRAVVAVEDHAITLLVGVVPTTAELAQVGADPKRLAARALDRIRIEIGGDRVRPQLISLKWTAEAHRPALLALAEWTIGQQAQDIVISTAYRVDLTWRPETFCREVSDGYAPALGRPAMASILLLVGTWSDCPLSPAASLPPLAPL